MSKGYSGLYSGTIGALINSTYLFGENDSENYSNRGIEIPKHIEKYSAKLRDKGDFITGSSNDFGMTDVSIMSKETGVEFSRVTIDNKSYLIRGDERGTVIPDKLLNKMTRCSGTLDFHSHPHNDDCIPSISDRKVMEILRKTTGQEKSSIVTPNGKTTLYDKNGVIETGTVSNRITEDRRKAFMNLFGGSKQ